MKYSLAFSAFIALCAAQDFPWDVIDSADPPPTVTVPYGADDATIVAYNSQTAVAAVVADIISDPLPQDVNPVTSNDKRDLVKRACQPQTLGKGPVPDVDTAAAFLSYPAFKNAAESAATPTGFALNYRNLNASSNAYGYMGFTLLDEYNTQTCASKCTKINGCRSFNIYFERDPAIQPGDACPNPQSTTLIKCVFWGGPTSVDNAKNTGFRYFGFDIVIAGSNAYDSLTAPRPNGYAAPTALGPAQINAPLDCGGFDTYMGSKMFTTGPFDPALCAVACSTQSEYNLAHPPAKGPAQTCQFYNTYLLLKNGLPEGQVCSMYSMSWDVSYASTSGQTRGRDHYTVAYSFTYSNATSPGSPRIPCPVASASSLISASPSLQPYCSTLLGYTTPVVTSTEVVPVTVPSATTVSTLKITTTITSTATTYVRVTVDNPNAYLNTATAVVVTYAPDRRAVPADVPEVLQTFNADVLSSACSLQAQVTPVTVTSTARITATSTVTDGQETVVVTARLRTAYTTVTSTVTTYVPPSPTNVMWANPAISEEAGFLKSCSQGICQSDYAPDPKEGWLVTDDGYLYSTTTGKYLTANIGFLYTTLAGMLGFGAVASKSEASPLFRKFSNGDGTSRVLVFDPSNMKQMGFCYVTTDAGGGGVVDWAVGHTFYIYNPTNDYRAGWCKTTELNIHD
ncbi:hypothetical protein F4808DRAFT_269718 [Astrocystis sublimbata]|nr:hypothetical protein F4808DRAFT_269718 [Astrocystis sublimbata]